MHQKLKARSHSKESFEKFVVAQSLQISLILLNWNSLFQLQKQSFQPNVKFLFFNYTLKA